MQADGKTGACLSVDEIGASSSLLGTNVWQEVKFEFNTGDRDVIVLGPRLGYFGSTCTGTAWFDDLRLEKIDGEDKPPASASER